MLVKNLIKVSVLLLLLTALGVTTLKFFPGVKDQPWNPFNQIESVRPVDESGFAVPALGETYVLEENDLFRNVPKSQSRHIFDWIDKYEFMQVNELQRMGFDDQYLVAEQNTHFILYRFGEDKMHVYTTEHDLQYDLYQLGHQIDLLPETSFQTEDDLEK